MAAMREFGWTYEKMLYDSDRWCIEAFSKDDCSWKEEHLINRRDEVLRIIEKLSSRMFFMNYGSRIEFGAYIGIKRRNESNFKDLVAMEKREGDQIVFQPHACDMNIIDGVICDELKCIAYDIWKVVAEKMRSEITDNQAFFIFHFLLNMLGFTYMREIRLHDRMSEHFKENLLLPVKLWFEDDYIGGFH